MAGKATPAVTALTQAVVAHTLHDYDHSGGTEVGFGLDAAHQLGLDPGRVFDRVAGLDDVPDGDRAMNDREAIKVMVRP